MGDVKDLANVEAIEKIRDIAKGADIGFFTTNLTSIPLNTRPMSTQDVDEEGNLWFFSREDSNKNMEIHTDNRVQLFYANISSSEYLSVLGEAEIFKDREKTEELWSPMVKAWFTEGKDDPSLTIIRVRPLDAYYWDTKNNKMVSLIKIMASVITGKTMDDGIEGRIKM